MVWSHVNKNKQSLFFIAKEKRIPALFFRDVLTLNFGVANICG